MNPIRQSSNIRSAASPARNRIPLWLKLAYTGFMAVLVPVYWSQYGPTNFLYFCDVALFLTLAALWLENSWLASTAAVGIVIPQFLWCADFLAQVAGTKITGMTAYMFDAQHSLFLRSLSFFHGWLPFLLIFLVARLGYDRRALKTWTVTAWSLMGVCYFLMPRPGAVLANPQAPVNINYVFGPGDAAAQTWMPEVTWVLLLAALLPLIFFIPAHFFLKRFGKPEVAGESTVVVA